MRTSHLTIWRKLSRRTQHWLVNIAIGVVIELLLHWAGHGPQWPVVVNAQNAALDRMMRASAAVPSEASPRDPMLPKLVFVDVDDQTWRDPRWGGGEPARAPRDELATLIEHAYRRGAKQVVLDIAIEGATGRDFDLTEDRRFATRIEAMLAAPWFGVERQLVLVRTLRRPLPIQARTLNTAPIDLGPHGEGYLDELRESPALDTVIAKSQGRIILAAPFFSISADHVVRDWQLLQVVCERRAGASDGVMRVVPSVQLVVAARHFGLPPGDEPWQVTEPRPRCTPFPLDAAQVLPSDRSRQAASALRAAVDDIFASSWRSTSQALRGIGIVVAQEAPQSRSLGNRVVFRWSRATSALPAVELLSGQVRHDLQDRVVLIGQTYPETVDRHFTPLGEMPGAVVLLNAIDSMARYRLIEPPSAWITMPLAFALIVFVGFVFARWNSTVGTLIATGVILTVLLPISFALFKHGVWLDFALPVLGIEVHRLIRSFEEYLERRVHASSGATVMPENIQPTTSQPDDEVAATKSRSPP